MLQTILERNTLKNSQLQSLYENLNDTKNDSLIGSINQDNEEVKGSD